MIGEKLQIQKYFGFLVTQLNYKGPVYYHAFEDYGAYFYKSNIVIDISTFGKCRVYIYKVDSKAINYFNEITNEIKPLDPSNVIQSYRIAKLDVRKKLWNSVSNDNFPDKDYWYNYKLISRNPSILNGNFKSFSLFNLLWKYLVSEKQNNN